jgi:hypothetical protein
MPITTRVKCLVGKATFPLEKNERKTGIIVKIQYGRCHGREAGSTMTIKHVRANAPDRDGTTPRTRLNIVIKAKPDKSGTEDTQCK